MRKFLFSLVLSTLLLAGNGWSATYYVNRTGGNDANNGLSTGSAWKTIAKVNASSFAPSDSILFKRGETWREQLTPPSSGSAGSPITFGAYGTGNAPIISGSDLVATWTVYSGNVYRASCSTEPKVVTFNNTMGIKETDLGNLNVVYEWYWTGSTLYVYSAGGDPDTVYTSPGIEAGKRNIVIFVNNKDYITIQNLQVWGGNGGGIYSQYEDHLSVDNVIVKYVGKTSAAAVDFHDDSTNGSLTNSTIQYSFTDGVWSRSTNFIATGNMISNLDGGGVDGIQTYAATAVTITGNTIDMTGSTVSDKHCIIVTDAAGPHVVSGNTLTGCPDQGIMIDANDIVVINNLIRNVGNSSIGIGINNSSAQANITIRYNVIYGCVRGINKNTKYSVSNLNIYNNIIYVTTGDALSYGLAPISGNIKNNIFYSASSSGRKINLAGSSIIGGETLAIDYNIIAPEGTSFIRGLNWTEHNTLAAWVSATGYDTHSKTSDPLFVSTVTPDFHLQSDSPAINAGTYVGLTRDFSGNLVPYGSAPDIGAYEYTPLNIPVPPIDPPMKIPKSPTIIRISP